jgi:ribosomal protein S18 acetylase RimI-like enzyme
LSNLHKEQRKITPLDNPVWHALTGPQRELGRATELVAVFDPTISPFGAMHGSPTDRHWRDLSELIGPRGTVVMMADEHLPVRLPDGWTVVWAETGVQMIGESIVKADGDQHPDYRAGLTSVPRDVLSLSADDVDDMLELVAIAQPGPFLRRTVEFGGYVGFRHGGRLVAMAGERLHVSGNAEISAVATHPDYRRQGLGESLVRSVAMSMMARDETPFLHATSTNSALSLYRSLGFTVRRSIVFTMVTAPG